MVEGRTVWQEWLFSQKELKRGYGSLDGREEGGGGWYLQVQKEKKDTGSSAGRPGLLLKASQGVRAGGSRGRSFAPSTFLPPGFTDEE